MAWARITHRYDDGTETEFAEGIDTPAYPQEMRELEAGVLRMYRDIVGDGNDTPDVLTEDEGTGESKG